MRRGKFVNPIVELAMDFKTFADSVAKNIKRLRVEKNLSQEAVSGLEMGVRTYQRIESGNATPSLESLFIIAMALGVQPKDLLDIPTTGSRSKKI